MCCVAVRSIEDAEPLVVDARWYGEIAQAPRGEGGFGYDPLFYVSDLGVTAAELDPVQKNRISHRGLALHVHWRKSWRVGVDDFDYQGQARAVGSARCRRVHLSSVREVSACRRFRLSRCTSITRGAFANALIAISIRTKRARGGAPEDDYLNALRADLEAALPLVWGRRIVSVFIGGGTPSLMSAQAVDRLLSDVRALLPLALDCEITLEANPGTFEAERFAAYRASGVNRLSIGIQSFDEEKLKALGRIHDARRPSPRSTSRAVTSITSIST